MIQRPAVLVASSAFATVVALGAHVPAAGAAFDVSLNTAGAYTVSSECHLQVGYTTDPRFITFVVIASSTAAGPSVPLSTTVQCTVYDGADRSRVYGGASGGAPGAFGPAVGQAIVPVGRIPAVCVAGAANFLDGTNVPPGRSCP